MLVKKKDKEGLTRIKSVCLNNWKVLGMNRLPTFSRKTNYLFCWGGKYI